MTIFPGLIHILLIDIDVVVAVAIVTPGIAKPSDKLHAAALFSIQLTANVFSANAIGKLIVPVPCVSVPTNPHCTLQWGYLSTYSNNIAYVSFPIAFNTTLRMAFTGDITESISTINSHSVGNVTSATMEIRQAQKMDTDGTYWLAIGR